MQKNFFYVTGAPEIGMNLTESLMLVPRKSVTAIIGLEKNISENKTARHKKSCANCGKVNCIARS